MHKVLRAIQEKIASLECEAWEIDPKLHEALQATLDACSTLAHTVDADFCSSIQADDYLLSFSNLFAIARMESPTHAILNPPYKKINSTSSHRLALRQHGVETGNLYSAFVALALMSMSEGGERTSSFFERGKKTRRTCHIHT